MIGWIILGIILLVGAFLLIVGYVDGHRFEVVEERFRLPGLTKSCTFVLLSDLHNQEYGHENDTLIKAIDEAGPDFIVIAGDEVTSEKDESIEPGVRLINNLSPKYKIYYGLGNHETKLRLYPDAFEGMYEKLMEGISSPNVEILDDKSISLDEYGIQMTGLELDRKYFAKFRRTPMEEGYLESKLGEPDTSKCNILIAHNPDYFHEYAKWGADLVLSGHVHGGIMRLPVIGGVIAPSLILFPKYDGGIFKEGKATMLLGRGMGSHTIPLRFFNPAQLYIVRLEKED